MHTFPDQQDKVYRPLLGNNSKLTGVSLQNSSLKTTHAQTVKWVAESAKAGKPWIVAFDESGSAAHGQCPDLGYQGFDGHDRTGKMVYTQHEVRKQTLWGTLMAGGAGCEYYFGYQFAENDIVARTGAAAIKAGTIAASRSSSSTRTRFHSGKCRTWMNWSAIRSTDISKFCFAKANDTYLVYLPNGGVPSLDLRDAQGSTMSTGSIHVKVARCKWVPSVSVSGGKEVALGDPPADTHEDWLVVIRNNANSNLLKNSGH